MANLTIPEPDASGYWHFTYITTDPIDGRWYGGKRSTRTHPLTDRYLGSGNWVRKHPERLRLRRKIVAFYTNTPEVFEAEKRLVTWVNVLDDPLCMNQCPGGDGMTSETAIRLAGNPEWRRKMLTAAQIRSATPEWRAKNAAANRRHAADPHWKMRHADATKKQWETPERHAIALAANRKTTEDPDWRTKNAEMLRLMRDNPEFRASLAIALANRSEEWRANVIAACRRRAGNVEWRAKVAAAVRRNNAKPEVKAKQVAAAIRRFADPAERAKISAAAFRREAHKRAAKATLILGLQLPEPTAVDL